MILIREAMCSRPFVATAVLELLLSSHQALFCSASLQGSSDGDDLHARGLPLNAAECRLLHADPTPTRRFRHPKDIGSPSSVVSSIQPLPCIIRFWLNEKSLRAHSCGERKVAVGGRGSELDAFQRPTKGQTLRQRVEKI